MAAILESDSPRLVSKQSHASEDADRKKRQSDLLDEALMETFPASDPVSVFRLE